ncbi:MAG: ribosome biogenesis GTPase A [bacterium]|jgi:ribosome biogenesis GTPase A
MTRFKKSHRQKEVDSKPKHVEQTKPSKKSLDWFPAHMVKALNQVQDKIKAVDLVVEVRDARIPLTSSNPVLKNILGQKKHLVVLNKANLADSTFNNQWKNWFDKNNTPSLFLNALDANSLKKIVPIAQEMMKERWETYRKKGIRPPPLRMMIVGIPNTGKSTIINRLTKRKSANMGDTPGVTRHQEWIVIKNDLELLDTPGILPPHTPTKKEEIWLSSIHAIKDSKNTIETTAKFLVGEFIQHGIEPIEKQYSVSLTGMSLEEILFQLGEKLHLRIAKGEINYEQVYRQVIKDFRKGFLGRKSFETPPIEIEETTKKD